MSSFVISFVSVSYTHLDVYKRQDENKPLWQMTSGEFMEFLKAGLNRTVATAPVSPLANTHKKYVYGIAGIATVSYTHLDVYKRQL